MIEIAADLVPLIRTGDFATLRDELSRLRPPEIAAALAGSRLPGGLRTATGVAGYVLVAGYGVRLAVG